MFFFLTGMNHGTFYSRLTHLFTIKKQVSLRIDQKSTFPMLFQGTNGKIYEKKIKNS
jgi:hypothetical protein